MNTILYTAIFLAVALGMAFFAGTQPQGLFSALLLMGSAVIMLLAMLVYGADVYADGVKDGREEGEE